MNTEVEELVYLSRYFGTRFDCIQASGGNISVKNSSGKAYIKSSGCALADLTLSSNYCIVDIENVNKLLSQDVPLDEILNLYKSDDSGKRPSMETPLHTILPQKYVVHIHPIFILAVINNKNVIRLPEKISLDCGHLFLNYHRPGIDLAKMLLNAEEIDKDKNFSVFLKNHGFIFAGNGLEDVVGSIEACLESFEMYLGAENPYRFTSEIQRQASKILGQTNCVIQRDFQKFQNHRPKFFSPDDVVYMGASIYVCKDQNSVDLASFYNENGFIPSLIRVQDTYYALSSNILGCYKILDQLESNLFLQDMVNENEKLIELDSKEVSFLANWDVEKYRLEKS